MKTKIKTVNFELTPSIKDYLDERLNHLDRFLPRDESVLADVELAKTTRHHQKGDIFKAEINLTVPGRLIRVAAEEWDLRAAIDIAKEELQEKITANKEKQASLYRRGARVFKNFLRGGWRRP